MRDGRASETAIVIAAGVALVAHSEPDARLVGERELELTEAFLRSSRRGRAALRLVRTPPLRPLARLIERLSVDGGPLHWVLRKRFIERSVRGEIDAGVRQVVVLGGGLDTLALRLAETCPGVRAIEIDHPATHPWKRSAVEAVHQGTPPPNLTLLRADLERDDPGEVLSRCEAYEPDAPVALVAEGLLMYLTPQRVGSLLAWVGARPAGTTLAMTSLGVLPDGRINFEKPSRVADAFLHLRGEPFRWGEDRASLADLVGRVGLEVVESCGADELRTRFLAGLPVRRPTLARGEYVALLRRAPSASAPPASSVKTPAARRARARPARTSRSNAR